MIDQRRLLARCLQANDVPAEYNYSCLILLEKVLMGILGGVWKLDTVY
jgi:hypothetical protein